MEVIILSFSILLSLILVFRLISKNNSLKNKISNLNSEISELNKKTLNLTDRINSLTIKESLSVGDKAIIFNYPLTESKSNTSFKVSYEVEIVEITRNKAKVKAIDYTSNDKYAKDPNNRSGIIGFMQNRWEPISSLDPIIDTTSARRNSKIDSILS